MTNDISLQFLPQHGAAQINRLAGKDVHGNEFEMDFSRDQLAAICNVIMKSQGEIFPVITMEKAGALAKIEIAGDAAPLFDLLEKALKGINDQR